MKTIRNIVIIGTICVLSSLLAFFSCRKTVEDKTQQKTNQTHSYGKTGCNCATTINSDCNDCVRNFLMKGHVTQSYGLTWDKCNNGCNVSGQVSSLTFCYDATPTAGSCDMWLYVDFLPSCLSGCIGSTGPVCLKVRGSCINNGQDAVVNGTYTDPNGVDHNFSFTFGHDPKVSVCCDGLCCTGEAF